MDRTHVGGVESVMKECPGHSATVSCSERDRRHVAWDSGEALAYPRKPVHRGCGVRCWHGLTTSRTVPVLGRPTRDQITAVLPVPVSNPKGHSLDAWIII